MNRWLLWWRRLASICASLFLFCLLFAFSSGPFYLYHWLGTGIEPLPGESDYIVMLGGGGFPGQQTLLRSWYTAAMAAEFPDATVIISQPSEIDNDSSDLNSAAAGIRHELILHGIDSNRIILETRSRNTREEALLIKDKIGAGKNKHITIVTSPEHMRRAILSFRRAGMVSTDGCPAFSNAGASGLQYNDRDLGGKNFMLPEMGNQMQLRYQFWNHLSYQIVCYRELLAIAWYKLRGWI